MSQFLFSYVRVSVCVLSIVFFICIFLRFVMFISNQIILFQATATKHAHTKKNKNKQILREKKERKRNILSTILNYIKKFKKTQHCSMVSAKY